MENGNEVRMCPKFWHCYSVVFSFHLLHASDIWVFLSCGNQWIVGVSNCTSLKLHLMRVDQCWSTSLVLCNCHEDVSWFYSFILQCMFVFCWFLSSALNWRWRRIEKLGYFLCTNPLLPLWADVFLNYEVVWELLPIILSSFLHAYMMFFVEEGILLVYIRWFWEIFLLKALLVCPTRKIHTWKKKGVLCTRLILLPNGMHCLCCEEVMLPALRWQRGEIVFTGSFGQVESDFWAWAGQTWKMNFSSTKNLFFWGGSLS